MNLFESLIVSIYRTCKFFTRRLAAIGLGFTLISSGASAASLQQAGTPFEAAAKSGTTAGKSRPSAATRARARVARIRAARARAARSSRALAEAKTPRYRTDAAGNIVPDVRAAAAIIYDPATGKVLY